MKITAITNHEEHKQALAKLLRLMASNPDIGSAEEMELDRLTTIIEAYEVVTCPIDSPTQEEAKRFRTEQMEAANGEE